LDVAASITRSSRGINRGSTYVYATSLGLNYPPKIFGFKSKMVACFCRSVINIFVAELITVYHI